MATTLAPTKVWQGLVSGSIQLGRALENDLSLDLTIEVAVWEQATKAHTAFWNEWANWRHALPGASGGSFHDIVRMFHLEERLINFMLLEPNDVVVDLGCGAAWMSRFLPATIAGYVGVDSHPATVEAARRELDRFGLTGIVIGRDLLAGLPKSAIEAIAGAERARILARWAFYLPMQSIKKIVRQAFDAGAYDLHVDQLTAGKFNPPVLMVHFIPFLAKGLATRRLTGDQVLRALKALGKMIPYGLELKRLFPLWSSDQLTEALNGLGCIVEVLERPLWGQTTFLRVTKPVP